MTFYPTLATLADIEAIEHEMPFEQRVAERSSYAVLARAAQLWPEKEAVIFLPNGSAADEAVTLTFAELFARATQAANLFRDLGVEASDTVSYVLPNLPQTYIALWGAAAAGIANPINPMLSPTQIAEVIRLANSCVLVTTGPGSELWDKLQAVLPLVPQRLTLLAVGGDEARHTCDFDRALRDYPADRLVSGRTIEFDEVAAYFHTGGTTGSPKLARHTHRGQVYQAWVNTLQFPMRPGDRLLQGAPLFHVAAVYCWGLACAYAGAAIVLLSPAGFRHPNVVRDYWRIVERHRASLAGVVPTVVSALLATPREGVDTSSLRTFLCGAAPLAVETLQAIQQEAGVPVLEGYGLTEATALATINPRDGERRAGSIGLRIPYTALKVMRLDGEAVGVAECGVDEIGVVALKGPGVTPGYLPEQHDSGAFFDGWLNTGDLGRMDKDGYIWLTGRAKDLIIRGGHNISPAWIEEVLHQHPAVALAAAVGRPDPYAGEIPIAYVTLKLGAQANPQELAQFARERVERPAAPAEVVILEAMPLTAVGKIYKPALREDAARREFERALAWLAARDVGFSVSVGPHPTLGTLARVALTRKADADETQLASDIDRALRGYTVSYRIAWQDGGSILS